MIFRSKKEQKIDNDYILPVMIESEKPVKLYQILSEGRIIRIGNI